MKLLLIPLMASLTVAAITFAAMGLRQYRRRIRLARLANEAALRFSIDDPFDIPRRDARMLLMSGGHSLAAHNVTYGCLQDSSVRAFDFHYEAGHGTQRQTRRFDAALFELSRSRPQLLLWRDGGGWISPADADGSIGPWSYIGSRPLAQAVLGAGFDHAAPALPPGQGKRAPGGAPQPPRSPAGRQRLLPAPADAAQDRPSVRPGRRRADAKRHRGETLCKLHRAMIQANDRMSCRRINVRNAKNLLMLTALAMLLLGPTGCSSTKTQHSEGLRQAVAKSQSLAQRALALLANPYYSLEKDPNQVTPLKDRLPGGKEAVDAYYSETGKDGPNKHVRMEDIAAKAISASQAAALNVGTADAVHPETIKDLETARVTLEAAVAANSEAGDEEKTLAKTTLANLSKLQAMYYASLAQVESHKLDPLVQKINGYLMFARTQAQTIAVFDKIANMGADEVNKFFDEAAALQKKFADAKSAKDAEIKTVSGNIEKLTADSTAQTTQIAQLGTPTQRSGR